MAMGTERSKPLHNFTMPGDLRWANQRHLRCIRVNSNAKISPNRRFTDNHSGHHAIQQRRATRDRDSSSEFVDGSPLLDPTPPSVGRRVDDENDIGIAAMREKVMFDLQTAAHEFKNAILKDDLDERETSTSPPVLPPPPVPASAEGEASRPWNLRTRRAAIKTPLIAGTPADGITGKGSTPNPGPSQIRPSTAASSGEKNNRTKFSVTLSKREIEEDFFAIIGHRPPRRPKKRSRTVQKEIETLLPGLWLAEVSADMYKVPEHAP